MTTQLTTNPLTPKQVWSLMVSAFEGGSNYWIEQVEPIKGETDPNDNVVWWGHECFWADPDFEVDIIVWEEDEHATLTPAKILEGQQKMLNEHPRHWADIINENDDAETADVFLQLCLFGEVVYG